MTDSTFAGVGQVAGLEVWRIEKLQPVLQQNFCGKLHTGDSYILLHTKESKSGSRSWDIHFWLGAETSQDEQGVAAYKTVELDESLGGGPVQYREVQGNESDKFLALFKNYGGIEYLPGGVESGFTHVDKDNLYPTRLLHIKGKRVVRMSEVPLSTASLNKNDVFILDHGLILFLFVGENANKQEKCKGMEMIGNINSSRGKICQIVCLQDEDEDMLALIKEHKDKFWTALGGEVDESSLAEGEADDEVPSGAPGVELYHISDASGSLEFKKVDITPKLSKAMLNGDDVFLLRATTVTHTTQLFVWVGRGSNVTEKKEATQFAVRYLKENNLPNNTRIERVMENNETNEFKSLFFDWSTFVPPSEFKGASVGTVASRKPDPTIDIAELISNKAVSDHVDMSKHGDPKITIYRIEDFKPVETVKESYGQFYAGDSYIVEYNYADKNRNNRPVTMLYFWLGSKSTADEKGAAALLAKEMDDTKYGGAAIQVRVVQNKEPAHFKQLFNNGMIVHTGGRASGFKNSTEEDSYDTDGIGLYHIRGTSKYDIVAVQVEEEAANLNSSDCFVLMTPTAAMVWKGTHALEEENTVGLAVANTLAVNYNGVTEGREVTEFKEGEEPDAFWDAMKGGKMEYATSASVNAGATSASPRLFHASTATGVFHVEEVAQFDQMDLNQEDVMLLDVYSCCYVWVGCLATAEERDKAIDFSIKYVTECATYDHRDPDCPVLFVQAGNEPELFISQFQNWDYEYASISATAGSDGAFVDMYQLQKNAIRDNNTQNQNVAASASEATETKAEDVPESTPVKGSASENTTPARTTPSRRPVSTRVAPRPQASSYLNMRSTDMSNRVKAANSNAFAFVSGGAGASGPVTKSSVSSSNYLNMRSTDMSNTAAKAANSNAFAFVSGGAGASGPVTKSSVSSSNYLNMRSTDMSNTAAKAANSNAFAFVSGGAGASGPVTKSSVSSTNYLNMRATDMSNTAAKAANSNAFAFVSGGAASTPPPVPAPAAAPLELTEDELVAYDDLVYEPPAHVDCGRKEEYLHDEDFQEIFLMSKAEFRALPKWKRDAKKKELQLF